MTTADELNEVYDALRAEGRCTTKKEFAAMMGMNYTTIITAMNDPSRYGNQKIVAKAKSLLLNEGTPAPAPAPVRKEIVIPPETMELYTNLSRTAAQLAETLDRLLSGETKKGAV